MSISLKVVDVVGSQEEGGRGIEDSVLVTFVRPGRVEIAVRDGRLIVHVYEGTDVDPEQPPLIGYEPNGNDLSVGETVER